MGHIIFFILVRLGELNVRLLRGGVIGHSEKTLARSFDSLPPSYEDAATLREGLSFTFSFLVLFCVLRRFERWLLTSITIKRARKTTTFARARSIFIPAISSKYLRKKRGNRTCSQ